MPMISAHRSKTGRGNRMRPRQHIRLLAWLITAVLLSNSGCTLLRRRREERLWQPPPPPHPWPEAAIAPEWPGRVDVADPTVDFFRVLGWSLESREVEASVFRRDADGRGRGTFTGLISLKGVQAGAGVILRPPAPLTLGEPFDTVELWVRALIPDQGTPPQGRVEVMVQTRDGTEHRIRLGALSGEWSLLRLRVDDRLAALTTHPCRFLGLRISDLPASDQFFLYLDNLAFYTEVARPLRLPPRPHLDLPHAPYRSRVLHRDEQRLPFPTRAETVRPDPTARGTIRPSISQRADQAFVLAPDAGMRRARYVFRPRHPERLLELEWDGLPVAVLLTSVHFRGLTGEDWVPAFIHLEEGRLTTEFLGGLRMEFSLSAASLILDLQNRRPVVEALDIGSLSSAHPLATRYMPGWTDPEHGGPLVAEIRPGGDPFFLSAIADPYRTQAAALSVVDAPARIHPVLLYHPKTDGRRRPLHERVIWTASSQLGEVLPVVPHPPSIYRSTLGRHLWDDVVDDRPDDPSSALMTRRLTAVEDISGGLFQQNPVLANSVDLLHIDPSRPGWSDAFVQREPDGNWRQLSAREYALKAPTAVEAFAQDGRIPLEQPPGRLAVTPAAFTGTRPWRLTDYDARNDDAASWRSVFLCYGELLDLLRAYRQRPVVALGAYAPLYAGLADGVVLEADPGRWPHQPLFHARRLAPLAVFYGAGAFDAFISDPRFAGLQPHEQADRYLAQQMAYGLAGRLIPLAADEALHRRSYLLMASLQPLLLDAPRYACAGTTGRTGSAWRR